jgi:hypothetical protein
VLSELAPPKQELSWHDALTDQFSAIGIESQFKDELKTQIKTKVKTRGTPADTDGDIDTPELDAPDAPVIIEVNKRAHRVFSTFLFHDPAQDPPPGEIAWTEFLYALS